MNYPYRKHFDEIKEGNEKYGGKTVEVTKDSLSYYKLLIICNRYLAPYVYNKINHIYKNYVNTVDELEGSLMHSSSAPKVDAGYVQYKGEVFTAENIIERKDKAYSKMCKSYNRFVLPVLKIHVSLLNNTDTIFKTEKNGKKLLHYAIMYSLPIPTAYEDLKIEGEFISNNYVPKNTWHAMVLSPSRSEKASGYLTFPKLTDEDLAALSNAGFQNLIAGEVEKYCTDNNVEIDSDRYIPRELYSHIRSTYYGWNSIPYIRILIDKKPSAEEAIQMFKNTKKYIYEPMVKTQSYSL